MVNPSSGPPDTATVRRPQAASPYRGAFSHRPAGYSSWVVWLFTGLVRDWKANLVALVAGWFGIPLAVMYSVLGALTGAVLGLLFGTIGAFGLEDEIPVVGEVLASSPLQVAGVMAVLGAALGLATGPLLVLLIPWVARFADDPALAAVVTVIHIVTALVISLLYVLLSVVFEPFRLQIAGARRLSRREESYLLPILHECAYRLGLTNVPRLLIDDGREANALAYTRHIVVYRGLLQALEYDRDAVAGVLSHELVHWHNADGVSRLALRGLALPLYWAYAVATWLLRLTDNTIIRFLVWMVSWPVQVTVRYLVVPVQSVGTRDAEYRADRGADLSAHRFGLRRALERFQRSFDDSRNGWDKAICASHPPTELRLERLEAPGEDHPFPPAAAERRPARAANPA